LLRTHRDDVIGQLKSELDAAFPGGGTSIRAQSLPVELGDLNVQFRDPE